MTIKPVRQVTPPVSRIWLAGIGAAGIAAAANAGWLWLCVNVFNWKIEVPKMLNSATLVDASVLRVTVATAIAGLFATLGALLLAKLVIGPRIWFLVLGLAFGLSTIYSAINIIGADSADKFALSVMHVIATVLIVFPIAEALKIRDSDLHRADVRYHEHLESKNSNGDVAGINMTAAGAASTSSLYTNTDTTIQPTDTAIIPTEAPTPDASSGFDGGGFSDGGSSAS
jgi:hypothetical protein